ncbi:hypothetical protein COT75_00075 [Candidatus Beckwithbacteria bacterium CG10_big_fil_rev_8_21_14_0_10_34_10]|uniref:O-antigen ligase-related domain-containing protein n=1 Tax=Candidatus Beckwithbacteria bacterium CG10_big_fil_rev_8_21_14_0_10_34_10 TaxID=1974495 RepID=A0A2H0WA99_9BACT|nr:MAG: hypothetical protein COT75_00075 [Candidatus Beckwithbacteria bacterium CG10_big_fil_rev_8_21_14_0_10_34_10]
MVKFILLALLLIFPLGQLSRLPFSGGEVRIYFHDLLVLVLILFFLGKKLIKKEKIKLPRFGQEIMCFGLVALFSLLVSFSTRKISEIKIGFLYLLRWASYPIVYLALSDVLNKDKTNKLKNRLNNLLILIGTTSAILGLLQYIFFPDIRSLMVLGWDRHYYRVVGTLLDPAFSAMIYVLSLILVIKKLWLDNVTKGKLIYFTSFILLYLSLALSYSRSAYFSFLLSITIFAFFKKSAKFFLSFLFLGIITIFLLPRPGGEGVRLERQSTIKARIINWSQTIQISAKYPLFGTGFNNYRYAQKEFGFLNKQNWRETNAGAGADSSLLFVLATTGIVGLTIYLNFLMKLFKYSKKNSLILLVSLVSVLANSFFNNTLFYPWVMIWLWILLALEQKG